MQGRSRTSDAVAWAVAWALAGVVLVFSLGPVPPGTGAFPLADKAMHAAGYAATVLAFLLAAVWRPGRGPAAFPGAAAWVVGLAVVAGVAIELAQGVAFGRDADLGDVVADVVGALAAWAGFAALRAAARRARRT